MKWTPSKFDRGLKYEAQTPFGPIVVLDDGNIRMCVAHPLKHLIGHHDLRPLEEAAHGLMLAYYEAIETEYDLR